MKKIIKHTPLILNIAIIVFGTIGCSMNVKYGLSILRYYTVLSNILGVAVSTLYLAFYIAKKGKVPLSVTFMKYASTVCLTLTFLVVTFVFVPMSGSFKVLLEGVNFYQHFLCPLLSLISFMFFEQSEALTKKHVFLSLIPTFTYAAVIIILNILRVVRGPYPFLMVYEQSVPVSVMWFFVINGMALATAALLRFITQLKGGEKR